MREPICRGRRTSSRGTVAALLLALAAAAMLPRTAVATDVTFTLKNCSQSRIDVRVYDRVDEIRAFPASGWDAMTYQQVIGFKCTRRKATDPNECTVTVTVLDGGWRQDYWVVNGNAESFCNHEPTRSFFSSYCSC